MSKEYITTSLSQGTAVKTKRPELPRVVLVGSFNDLFLEALTELKFEFELYKGSKAAKSVEFDIVVLSSDRADQSLDYIQKFKDESLLKGEGLIFIFRKFYINIKLFYLLIYNFFL
jgi:hypothetical protein